MNDKTLSIVVPVYQNAESLPFLFAELEKLEGQLAEQKVGLELIFVDDGSRDDSLERLLAFREKRPGTKVVKLARNFGAVRCSRTGFQFVTGDAFLIMAADLQDPPALVLEMVARWSKGARFVICTRESRGDPRLTRLFSGLYYRLLRWLVVKDYPMGGFDMALMDKAFLPYLRDAAKSAFTPLLAYWLGFKPEVISYHRPRRQHGKSMWTFSKKVGAFLDALLGFSTRPIRLISAIGALVAVMSFVYGITVIVSALLNKIPVDGFATIVALVTFLLGLIILMLGVIGEYLWRIFEEVNKRPDSVIEKVW